MKNSSDVITLKNSQPKIRHFNDFCITDAEGAKHLLVYTVVYSHQIWQMLRPYTCTLRTIFFALRYSRKRLSSPLVFTSERILYRNAEI